MGLKIITTIKGFPQLLKTLKGTEEAIKDTRGANLAAATVLRAWIDRNFKAEGGLHEDATLKWKKLSPITIAMRRKGKKNFSDKILQDTGKLKENFQVSATSQRGRVKSTESSASSLTGYASIHEFGNDRIPKRKIFPTVEQGRKIVIPAYIYFIKRKNVSGQ